MNQLVCSNFEKFVNETTLIRIAWIIEDCYIKRKMPHELIFRANQICFRAENTGGGMLSCVDIFFNVM